MSANDLILLILVAAGAFYAGYQAGRLKALSERGPPRETGDANPLPGPLDGPTAPSSPPPRRGAPPPVSAGNEEGSSWSQGSAAGTGPARRSTKPPPAAAGLMSPGDKTDKGQK